MSDKKYRWITYAGNQTGDTGWTVDWESWNQWQPQVQYPFITKTADNEDVIREIVRLRQDMKKLEELLKELLQGRLPSEKR